MPSPDVFLPASPLVTIGFVVLPLLVAAAFVAGCHRAGAPLGESVAARRRYALRVGIAAAAWLVLTGLVAASGVLRRFDVVPPPFAGFILVVAALGITLPCSSVGTRLVRGLPLWLLVGSQVFRFPLELVMHRAYVEGIMPVQMSYSGRNFDVVTGVTAGLLGWQLARRPVARWLVSAWNVLGLALLVNVVAVAIVSTPLFRWFGDDRLNVFVTYPPFVWLPAVLVTAALSGHILVWRALAAERAGSRDRQARRARSISSGV
jgi:hypothetical protein